MGILFLERGVLFLKLRNPLTKLGNFIKQLLDKVVSRSWWKLGGAVPRAWWDGSGGEVKVGG